MWFTPGGRVALRVTDGVNLRASITSCNETFTGLGFSFRAQGFPCALVKNLPAMREAWVRSLGWEDPLQKGTTAHSCSGLENFMGRRAWQATVYGVTKSRTRLSDLHSLTSGHRNFVNDCKFSKNQQDSLLSGEFDEQAVIPQGGLPVPGPSPPALCSGVPRRRSIQPPGLSSSGCVPRSGQSQVKVGSVTSSPAGAG